MNKLIPQSTATNAYDLLTEVTNLILEDVKRVAMKIWATTDPEEENLEEWPSCDMVGCIGGWIDFLFNNYYRAREILGLSRTQSVELFYDTDLMNARYQQTPEHAEAVAYHIRKFQAKYEEQLRGYDVTRFRTPEKDI